MDIDAGRYHSFVVRIWSREGDVVQGQITHVATRKTMRFRDSQRMIDFILAHLRTPREEMPEGPEPPIADPTRRPDDRTLRPGSPN